MTHRSRIPTLATSLVLAACSAGEPTAPAPHAELPVAAAAATGRVTPARHAIDDMNAALASTGADVRVAMMETLTHPSSGEFGTTVFSRDVGNQQLSFHFAPALVFQPGSVTYAVDEVQGAANGGLGAAQTSAAIDAAMTTWDAPICSDLSLARVPGLPGDFGFAQFLLGFGGTPALLADIMHAGWLPGAFFDLLEPDGSEFILGVTFTFIWVDDDGLPIDTNRDGKPDVAFREIYYNDAFAWADTPQSFDSPFIDVQSVVLHEAGHGLSQGHFGTVFFDGRGTTQPSLRHLHFSPRAVMNAIYWDTLRELLGSDEGGHCGIWGDWPR